jgi:B12-binding domain/radical SAM domain protein
MNAQFPLALHLTRHYRNSIAALLAVLEAELPAGLVATRLLNRISDFDGNGLLACSFTSLQADSIGRELRPLFERGELLAVAGGPHPSGAPQQTRAMGFRWVVAGEAGAAFAGLVRALAAGERPEPGVLTEEPGLPLDRYLPWPRSGELFSHIEITRGCPMGCTFCQTPRLFGRKPRHRSLQQLERIFAHAVGTEHRYTRFVAPNAFGYGSEDGLHPNPRAVEALLRAARRAGFQEVYLGTFPSEVRPESVTDEMLALVREHCDNRSIAVGLQSGSEQLLRRLKRGHGVRDGVAAIERIARAGFVPKVDFMFGLPEETDEDRAETRRVIAHLIDTCGATVHAHVFTPLPGTPLADAAPSVIDPATRELMALLAGTGRATGVREGRCD